MRLFEYLKLKKKILFVFLGSLFSLVAIFVGTFYVTRMRQEPSRSKAGGGVSLYFDPANPTLGLNSNFTLNVKVSPGLEKISAVELYLTFDKDKLQVTSIESVPAFSAGVAPKTFLKDPVTDNSLGKASVIVGVLPEAPVGSISDVVIIRGKTKNVPGNTLITITQDSKVAAIGKTSNVVEIYGQASLNIIPLPMATATPIVTATATVNSTPSSNQMILDEIIKDNFFVMLKGSYLGGEGNDVSVWIKYRYKKKKTRKLFAKWVWSVYTGNHKVIKEGGKETIYISVDSLPNFDINYKNSRYEIKINSVRVSLPLTGLE